VIDAQRVAVVIPAFNVANRVGRVVKTVPRWVDRVYVVDDGSSDGTSRVTAALAREGLSLRTHDTNRGVGAAIATGYRAALAEHMDVIAVMAGDGQMDPDDLASVVYPVTSGRAHYAKGNRLRHRELLRAMPPVRLAGNVVLSTLTRAATGLWHVGDSQCGYTAIHHSALRAIDLDDLWPRYGYPNDLLSALALKGFRVTDVTVRPVYEGAPSGVRWRDALVTIPKILARAAARGAILRARR
jgi:glycosyltransferase involved in cell wall biosynthesis